MSLSKIDIEAILDGTAHTGEAPSECDKLMRMTGDNLSHTMTNVMPSIVAKRDRRVLQACLHLQELIAEKAVNSEIFTATLKLDVSVPFGKKVVEIMTYCGNSVRNTESQQERSKKINILMEECNFLKRNSGDPSFSRFHGAGGAHILRMNGTLRNKLSLSYEEALCYISMIIEVIIFCISKGEKSNNLIIIDQERLSTMKNWMDVVFEYRDNSYEFELIGSPSVAVPEKLFTAVAALLSLHVPGTPKVIQIEEKNGAIEISGNLKRNKNIPEESKVGIGDLKHSSYYGAVEGSNFLDWLASSLPSILNFRVENERLIFRITPPGQDK